jgi:hypothetical protein
LSSYSHRRHQERGANSSSAMRQQPRPHTGLGNAKLQALLQQRQAENTVSSTAFETQSSDRSYGAFTTGRTHPGSGVESQLLDQGGNWDTSDLLDHHSDRSTSWAAENIRNAKNQDLQAYDFTFESLNEQDRPIDGTAQGLPLYAPVDSKVIDVQLTPAGSGRYGCFVVMEYLDSGLRISVHHLASVENGITKGGQIKGGEVFGYQGGSGNVPGQYPTHVDIVGTIEAVEAFVRTNQTGDFKTKVETGNRTIN